MKVVFIETIVMEDGIYARFLINGYNFYTRIGVERDYEL